MFLTKNLLAGLKCVSVAFPGHTYLFLWHQQVANALASGIYYKKYHAQTINKYTNSKISNIIYCHVMVCGI